MRALLLEIRVPLDALQNVVYSSRGTKRIRDLKQLLLLLLLVQLLLLRTVLLSQFAMATSGSPTYAHEGSTRGRMFTHGLCSRTPRYILSKVSKATHHKAGKVPTQVGTQTNTMQLWCKWYLILVIHSNDNGNIMARIIESNSCKDEKNGLPTHH